MIISTQGVTLQSGRVVSRITSAIAKFFQSPDNHLEYNLKVYNLQVCLAPASTLTSQPYPNEGSTAPRLIPVQMTLTWLKMVKKLKTMRNAAQACTILPVTRCRSRGGGGGGAGGGEQLPSRKSLHWASKTNAPITHCIRRKTIFGSTLITLIMRS